MKGDFDRIRWYVVYAESFWFGDIEVIGLWGGPDYKIYIAEPFVHDRRTVAHEMLHDLMGRPGHPDVPFVYPCDVR